MRERAGMRAIGSRRMSFAGGDGDPHKEPPPNFLSLLSSFLSLALPSQQLVCLVPPDLVFLRFLALSSYRGVSSF